MFKSSKYMNLDQQKIADDFLKMIETEYALCLKEIKNANSAIILPNLTEISESDDRHLDMVNREMDSISSYWQQRLGNLINSLEAKDYKLNQELAEKYLKKAQ